MPPPRPAPAVPAGQRDPVTHVTEALERLRDDPYGAVVALDAEIGRAHV